MGSQRVRYDLATEKQQPLHIKCFNKWTTRSYCIAQGTIFSILSETIKENICITESICCIPEANQFSWVQFSRSVVSDSLQPHESQHARPHCSSPSPGVHSDSHPPSPWCHPAISSSAVPSPPALNPSQHQSLFQWVNSSHEVAKVLEFQPQILLNKIVYILLYSIMKGMLKNIEDFYIVLYVHSFIAPLCQSFSDSVFY